MREHRGRTTTGWWWVGWLGVWWLVGGVPITWAAERLALVIGNAQYSNERPLVNTLNDARAVADQLRGLGFEVALHENLAAIPMRREINRFLEEVKGREGTVQGNRAIWGVDRRGIARVTRRELSAGEN